MTSIEKKLLAVLPINPGADRAELILRSVSCDNSGADGLLLLEGEGTEEEHEIAIGIIREISRAVDIPLYAGGWIRRLEDVKKYIYAGAAGVFFDVTAENEKKVYEEGCDRFGVDRCLRAGALSSLRCAGLSGRTDIALSDGSLLSTSAPDAASVVTLLQRPSVLGALLGTKEELPDFYALKACCEQSGLRVSRFAPALSFSDLKPNADGLIPVIVQDYKTSEVLMLAYMNEEAYNQTCETGRMTYFSRSRQQLWVKGLTSGHFQYVRELTIDCDNDTLLARVKQIGVACHTGSPSCFYRTLAKKDYAQANPRKVFEKVYDVINDRKQNPREGSYTNYLFQKGIDKILKKIGEETTEIVIASKNPDAEEIKYEISDFLYHIMVLMVEKGVTWEDITRELAKRE